MSGFELHHKVKVIKMVWYQQIQRRTDQRNRRTARTESRAYTVKSYFTAEPRILTGEKTSLQQMVLGKVDIQMQKDKTGPLPYAIHKNRHKSTCENLHVRPKPITPTEENRKRLLNTGLGSDFLTPRAELTKAEINKPVGATSNEKASRGKRTHRRSEKETDGRGETVSEPHLR